MAASLEGDPQFDFPIMCFPQPDQFAIASVLGGYVRHMPPDNRSTTAHPET
jgi:hypothetical protein